MLAFSLTTYPYSKVTKTGLYIYLDAENDNFTHDNIINFNTQLDRLNYTRNISLHRSKNIAKFDFSDCKTLPTGKDIY